MSYKIITHNGKAHMDELVGIALISIKEGELPTEIIRVAPDSAIEELKAHQDQKCFVVDCGLKFEPNNFFFDHHQSNDLGCAALLIFETYFSHLIDTNLHEYIKLVSSVDTKGPNSLDDFKFNSDSINYFSFPQRVILKEFEKEPLIIASIFTNGINSIIDFEKDKVEAAKWLDIETNSTILTIEGVNILSYNTPPPVELSNAIKSLDSEITEKNDIHVIYSYDKEDNNNRTLYRTFKGDNVVDFSKADVIEPLFCHKGGFLLKFRPNTTEEWKSIIEESKK